MPKKTDLPNIFLNNDGLPLTLYHGTNAHAYSDGQIEEFSTQPTSGRGAAFFTSDRALAEQYGERVYEVNLTFKNPLIVFGNGKSWSDFSADTPIDGRITGELRSADEKEASKLNAEYDELSELFGDDGFRVSPKISKEKSSLNGMTLSSLPGVSHSDLGTDSVVKAARKLGFDGVIFKDIQDSPTSGQIYSKITSDVFAAFSSCQIQKITQYNVGDCSKVEQQSSAELKAAIGAKGFIKDFEEKSPKSKISFSLK